jgi:hypothetical protein
MARLQRFRCMVGSHAHLQGAVWNDPYWFGRCFYCDQPMIRRPGARWTGVPQGFRVVWRSAKPDPTVTWAGEAIDRITVQTPRSLEHRIADPN